MFEIIEKEQSERDTVIKVIGIGGAGGVIASPYYANHIQGNITQTQSNTNLGGAYFSGGQLEKARSTWEFLLTNINPNNEKAKQGYAAASQLIGQQR